jgi:hypothetical protein
VVGDAKDCWNIGNNDAWVIRAGGVDALESPAHGALLAATIPPASASAFPNGVTLLESAELSGVSENPRGYSDPNSEAEHLQKDSRENGNGGGQVASPANAAPCGNECRKSKTKRCYKDHKKQVARKNLHRVR